MMQVEILPAVPLPGGVKVARRSVKPLVLVRVQVWQPILRKAGRYKLAAPVPKTGSAQTRGRSVTDAFRHFKTINERKPMKPILRYQSQLRFRKSYKPKRVIRIRPVPRLNIVFRPVNRFGVKPQLT